MKQFVWILIIAVGVFIGITAKDKYDTYQLQQYLKEQVAQFQAQTKHFNELTAAAQAKQKKAEFSKSALCAMNVDSGNCICRHKKSGLKISMSKDECITRSRQITW